MGSSPLLSLMPSNALEQASLEARHRNYAEAIRVLRSVDRRGLDQKSKAIHDDALEVFQDIAGLDDSEVSAATCAIFEDILSIVGGYKNTIFLGTLHRDRLLRLTALLMSPLFAMMGAFGSLTIGLGRSDGKKIFNLVDDFRDDCWVNGLPVSLDFFQDTISLTGMKGYNKSMKVFKKIFLAFLDYCVDYNIDTGDWLLASLKPGDAHALYCSVREARPDTVLEIGSFIGFSTAVIAYALKDNGKGNLHCIDPNVQHLSVRRPMAHAWAMLKRLNLDTYVTCHKGFFSRPLKYRPQGREVLGEKIKSLMPTVDLAFIDGDHSTIGVLQDILLVLPHLSKKATLVLHDVRTWSTVRRAIITIFRNNYCRQQMSYYQVSPSGNDGIGIIYLEKFNS